MADPDGFWQQIMDRAEYHRQKNEDKWLSREAKMIARNNVGQRSYADIKSLLAMDADNAREMFDTEAMHDFERRFGNRPDWQAVKDRLNEKDMRHLRQSAIMHDDFDTLYRAIQTDIARENGQHMWGFGLKTDYVPGSKLAVGAKFTSKLTHVAATAGRAAALVAAPMTLGGSLLLSSGARSIIAQNLGHTTAMTRVQMAQAGFFGRTMGIGLPAAFGVFNVAMAAQASSPGIALVSSVTMSVGAQAGWQAGKAVGSLLARKNAGFLARHIPRTTLGLAGGFVGALPGIAMLAFAEDLTKNDSTMVKLIREKASKEVFANTPDSRMSATLRQKSLQKLSASAMNDRGQLLGNEAMILRGAPHG